MGSPSANIAAPGRLQATDALDHRFDDPSAELLCQIISGLHGQRQLLPHRPACPRRFKGGDVHTDSGPRRWPLHRGVPGRRSTTPLPRRGRKRSGGVRGRCCLGLRAPWMAGDAGLGARGALLTGPAAAPQWRRLPRPVVLGEDTPPRPDHPALARRSRVDSLPDGRASNDGSVCRDHRQRERQNVRGEGRTGPRKRAEVFAHACCARAELVTSQAFRVASASRTIAASPCGRSDTGQLVEHAPTGVVGCRYSASRFRGLLSTSRPS